jgi:tetratricopeptide (TPR) repeat protein
MNLLSVVSSTTLFNKKPDKKNWLILEIVRDYFYSYIQFQSFYEKYKTNTLNFDEVEKFITDKDPSLPLFNLKESCHMLFRYQGEEQCSEEERLLDLAVGSIFHEAMKIRENLYLLEVYKPRYLLQVQSSKEVSNNEKKLLQAMKKIGVRTEMRLHESITEIKRLFEDTLKQIANLLPLYKDNPVLMRFLLRNKNLLQQTMGKRKGLKIISDIFPGGLGEAYYVEGKGYLESEHYDLAADFFNQALKYRFQNFRLKGLYLYARSMDGYYKNRYQDTLRSINKLIPFADTLKDDKKYLKKVEEVCRKIGREYLEDKKRKLGQVALQLADKVSGVSPGK